MPELDITQHIVSAGRGNFNDLAVALNDIHARLATVEASGYLAAATAAQTRASASGVAMVPSTWTGALASVSLTDEATVAIDFDAGRNFHLAIGGNRTMANAGNRRVGQSGMIWIEQPAGGGHTLAWSATWAFAGGAPTLAAGASAISLVFYYVITVDRTLAAMITNAT